MPQKPIRPLKNPALAKALDAAYAAFISAQTPDEREDTAKTLHTRLTKFCGAQANNWRMVQHAEDIAQEVFMRVLRKQYTGENGSTFSHYVARIIDSVLADLYNKNKKRSVETSATDENGEDLLDTLDFGPTSPEESLIAKIDLENIIKRLRPEEQQLMKWKLDGMTCREIGERVGKSEDAVRKAISRLETKIAEELGVNKSV